MQRIRMSLPYFKQFGWEAEVITVDPIYSDLQKDELLAETIPADIKIHTVKALNKKWTSKLGFGSLAFRSYWFYLKQVNKLLKKDKFDLIYFSTTQFPVCVLGAYWKKQFGVPYVIDMQDAWYSEYYKDKPKHQQPPKYKFVYGLHKLLESIAMKQVDGLISVSENYIHDLKDRYPEIKHVPAVTIPFGCSVVDMQIAAKNKDDFSDLLTREFKNIVYIGRGGFDMHSAITPVFNALKQALTNDPDAYNQLKLYFIGTSYNPSGDASILPLAKQIGVENNVIEVTRRIGYFHTLVTLQNADALFIPGSDDPKYTASKIYPYLLANKPLLTVFNSKSPALTVLNECGVEYNYSYDATPEINVVILNFFTALVNNQINKPVYNDDCIENYSALKMTEKQCNLFDRVFQTVAN
jgi:hypothetical protein